MTVSCPLDCPHLQDARRHEKPRQLDPEKMPHRDIRVSEEFLAANEPLLAYTAHTLAGATMEAGNAVDLDVREAMESMIRTHRTLDSGLYYQSRPNNLIAGVIQERLQQGIDEFRREVSERTGSQGVRDKDVLGTLVFLARMEFQTNNGRPRSRAFIDFIQSNFLLGTRAKAPSLIVPGA